MTNNNSMPDITPPPAPEFPDSSEFDRGIPGLGAQKKKLNHKIVLIGLVVVIGLVIGVLSLPGKKKDDKVSDRAKQVQSNLPPMPEMPRAPKAPALKKEKEPDKKTAIAAPVTVQAVPAPTSAGSGNAGGKKPMTPEERKLLSNNIVFGGKGDAKTETQKSGQRPDSSGMPLRPTTSTDSAPSDLAQKTTSTKLTATSAGILRNRSYFVTAGQFLDCVLETAIDSTVSGMVRAVLSKDVYSTDGKVILLDKGTRLIGQYQRGLKQGEARLFVLWTRAETPNGVMITLDSPGADPLGRSGMDGYIDYHFFERFGAAIMFSMIDDLGRYLVNELSSNNSGQQNLNFSSTGDAAKNTAGIALENSIKIPPTLRKNQGDHVMVYVARDLDFSTVYDLEVQP